MPGSAITSVKIEGVMHEFQKIDGVVEDVTSIVLAVKGLVLKNHSDELKTLHLSSNKEGVVTAGDIEKDADVEVINPDLVICLLTDFRFGYCIIILFIIQLHDAANADAPVGNGLVRSALRNRFRSGKSDV